MQSCWFVLRLEFYHSSLFMLKKCEIELELPSNTLFCSFSDINRDSLNSSHNQYTLVSCLIVFRGAEGLSKWCCDDMVSQLQKCSIWQWHQYDLGSIGLDVEGQRRGGRCESWFIGADKMHGSSVTLIYHPKSMIRLQCLIILLHPNVCNFLCVMTMTDLVCNQYISYFTTYKIKTKKQCS